MGLVTSRDIESLIDRSTLVVQVMTGIKDLSMAQAPLHLREARERMQQAKVGKLPVVNEDNELVALICRGDIRRAAQYPGASRDANRQLLVAAEVCADEQDCMDRTQALVDAGADIIALDTSGGISQSTVEVLKNLKENCSGTDVLVGHVSTLREAMMLLEAKADGLRIGFSAFSGAADAASVYEIARIARNTFGVPVCAEGVEGTDQMLKALCLGASTVTASTWLSQTEEAPGDHIYRDGVRMKIHSSEDVIPGMPKVLGVAGAPCVRKGVAGPLVTKGSARALLPHIAKKLRAGLQELGVRNVNELHNALASGTLRMERRLPQFPVAPSSSMEPQKARMEVSSLHTRW